MELTNRDWFHMTKTLDEVTDHNSGSSYNMLARYVKGQKLHTGRNNLYKPARNVAGHYPDICGTHAELDLWRICGKMLSGGTLYVAGRRAKNNSIMGTTKPCEYCSTLLYQTRLNWVVFLDDGKFVKTKPKELI